MLTATENKEPPMDAPTRAAAALANPPNGVYKNPRLMHACTTIVGFTVHLQTKDGSIWEGVFNTFSPDFTICLDLAIQIDPKLANNKDCLYIALKNGSQAKKQAFFDLKDIVRITVADVDLNYATKSLSKLTTDADISGFNANKSNLGEQRQLESWCDEDGESLNPNSTLLSLEDSSQGIGKNGAKNNIRSGWDAQDMFRFNERVYKVTTTYDEKLTDYTLPLPKQKDTKEWRKRDERATALAKEIENNPKSQVRLAKEDDGDCEEEKFSAVHRPTPQPPTQVSPPVVNPAPQPQQQQQQVSTAPPPAVAVTSPRPQAPMKNFRTRTYDRTRLDSLKNFGKQLTLAPTPRKPQPMANQHMQQKHQVPQHQHQQHNQPQSSPQQQQMQSPHQASSSHQSPQPQSSSQHHQNQQHQQQHLQQHHHQQHQQPQQPQTQQQSQQQPQPQPQPQQQQQPTVTTTTATTTNTPATPTTDSRNISTSSSSSSTKDNQSELARKSKLNPNAKEFVYRPATQPNEATVTNQNTSSLPQPHAAYYQHVPVLPHPHFQSQIHYISAMNPHFAQQRYIRNNFQNYYHQGEHHNNIRADYSQAAVIAPTSTGRAFVPPPSGAPHPINPYASHQQPVIYGGPPQSMYPMVQGFPQHMPHVMPNPPPYDGSTVYMPNQNYIVNP